MPLPIFLKLCRFICSGMKLCMCVRTCVCLNFGLDYFGRVTALLDSEFLYTCISVCPPPSNSSETPHLIFLKLCIFSCFSLKMCMWSGTFESIIFWQSYSRFWLRISIYKACVRKSFWMSYPIFLKLCMVSCSGMKMCMCVWILGSIICHSITIVWHLKFPYFKGWKL